MTSSRWSSAKVSAAILTQSVMLSPAETLSRNLCREYRSRFGDVLHHNVDKALLCGGRSAPRIWWAVPRSHQSTSIWLAERWDRDRQ